MVRRQGAPSLRAIMEYSIQHLGNLWKTRAPALGSTGADQWGHRDRDGA